MITFSSVSKYFEKTAAVNNLSIDFAHGSVSVIIGPSGCGKTTTMKMINRLIDPDNGEITLDGKSIFDYNLVELRRSIGYVIQETGLFPHYTVYDNIAVVPRLLRWDNTRIHNRVYELLDLVTLNETYSRKYPSQLSGGERQRVGLARALAADPDILLMDEPFGAIDPINRLTLQDVLLEIQEEIKKTIIFVTHDINEAIKLGGKIAIMDRGNLVQYDTPDIILTDPADEFVEELLGHDRNVKALSLIKTRELLQNHGYITITPGTTHEQARAMAEENPASSVFIQDDNGTLMGRYYLETRKDGSRRLKKVDDPWVVDANMNLNETLSKMLQTGEKVIPVVTRKRKLLGVVTLGNLFNAANRE